jgi:hypothetical protein
MDCFFGTRMVTSVHLVGRAHVCYRLRDVCILDADETHRGRSLAIKQSINEDLKLTPNNTDIGAVEQHRFE